ncbi:OLC1v1003970C1 [Oldenlandia corymbosa var. corymbosa]|uniref:Beta-galactosidase n=1 Tax=Oldenlandia corymbosa var. corymbosa TaxID=529605 RepID=A0AAV1DB57_OLDCO|nr:OLC1v1003970C1 [Oldenlandia corymbosa var. corymbosa]
MKGATLLFSLVFLSVSTLLHAGTVTYDHRAISVDGKRRILISGSIHYPRSTPQMWPALIQKAKDGGLDVIETYVFWDISEPVRGQYDFTGRKDLVQFLKLVNAAGLYAVVRIGPYVCAEWNYGGFPLWLHFIPGIEFRTDNQPFKAEMQRFTTYIVNMLKQQNLFRSQGGPIILSQIENEYGNSDIGPMYGARAKPYVDWAAGMAVGLNTGVPWIMCQQKDAPDPLINTCNGFYCDQFTPNSDKKPKMWTENWTGWFLAFGGAVPLRPAEDVAFAVARFFQLSGSFQNYYMYHGGTNFGRTSGGPFISTSYDYDAPLDEYGLPNRPKWGHLKDLHAAIKLCEPAMVATDPTISSLGKNLEAAVYKTASGLCAAFLANFFNTDATANFNGNNYSLPAWSVSILPDCKNVVFNSAKINAMTSIPTFVNSNVPLSGWSWVNEPVGISQKNAFSKQELVEQVNTTGDRSDYLWYSTSINVNGNERFLQSKSQTVLQVNSLGHALHVFVNGKKAGSVKGSSDNHKVTLDIPIPLNKGQNTIDLLSLTVGLQNYGAFFDTVGAGITGPVQFKGSGHGSILDLSSQQWKYQIGLKGTGQGDGGWTSGSKVPKNQPLIWYKANFDAPAGSDPVALKTTGLGKGEAWVNGQSIGRFWPSNIAPKDGCKYCDYRGNFDSNKCLTNCGQPSQLYYHVPREWLKPKGNVLVLFEEEGGDPTQISFATRQISSLSRVELECPSPNQVISAIKFAGFGNPKGTCGSFSQGDCNSNQALSIVQKVFGLRVVVRKIGNMHFSRDDSWTKECDECVKEANGISIQMPKKPSEIGFEAGRHTASLRRKITILGTKLDTLQSSMNSKKPLLEKEMNRRKDMIADLRSNVNEMANALNMTSFVNKYSLLGPETNPTDDALSLTQGLDNQGVVEIQQQIMNEQDESLGKLEETVGSLKHIALAINEELDLHEKLLDEFHEELETADANLGRVQRKLEEVKKRSRGCCSCLGLLGSFFQCT